MNRAVLALAFFLRAVRRWSAQDPGFQPQCPRGGYDPVPVWRRPIAAGRGRPVLSPALRTDECIHPVKVLLSKGFRAKNSRTD
ncbi:hypothetical protein B0H13DRAFT_2113921 [Mycena leptocephala]|nr:hypothetical protein B0H13DRAFT_2113921 [Mycena leptocephala]